MTGVRGDCKERHQNVKTVHLSTPFSKISIMCRLTLIMIRTSTWLLTRRSQWCCSKGLAVAPASSTASVLCPPHSTRGPHNYTRVIGSVHPRWVMGFS